MSVRNLSFAFPRTGEKLQPLISLKSEQAYILWIALFSSRLFLTTERET